MYKNRASYQGKNCLAVFWCIDVMKHTAEGCGRFLKGCFFMKKTDKTQVPEKTGKVQKTGGNTKSCGTDGKVSVSLEKNEAWIKERCANCADIMMHKMYLGREADVAALLVFGEVTVTNTLLEDSLIGKMMNELREVPSGELAGVLDSNALGVADTIAYEDRELALAALLAGNAVLFLDGYSKAVKIASKGYPAMVVQKADTEKALRGSRESFTESVKLNEALVRKRIRNTGLKVEEITLGKRSATVTALVYMEDLIYPEILERIRQEIGQWEIDGVFDTGMLEQLCQKHWLSPFPQFETTERPDRAAMEVLNGRILFLCDNSPTALVFPTTFNDFMQVSEDRYHWFGMVTFLRVLRYLAMAAALMISGCYLAVTCFHTQILPTNLLLSFAEARKGVPFPGIIEILLMEMAFELIREAGVRMPGPLGGTIGIVGGLIIGDAAVSANLVSPMTVVVVAFSALSSFAIPKEEFSVPFRLLKYGFIFLGGFFGIFGIVLGIYLLLGHLAGLTSFGIPYLMPFVGKGLEDYRDPGDDLVRLPFHLLTLRPVFARRHQRVRMRRKGEKDVRGQ